MALTTGDHARAEDCLLDRDGSGDVTLDKVNGVSVDNDANAESDDLNSALACGVDATSASGGTALGYSADAGVSSTAIGREGRGIGGLGRGR